MKIYSAISKIIEDNNNILIFFLNDIQSYRKVSKILCIQGRFERFKTIQLFEIIIKK